MLKQGYLDKNSTRNLHESHPLILHLDVMRKRMEQVDFRSLREYNPEWHSQTNISKEKSMKFMACLYHYNFSVANVMRFASNNYTGEYRRVPEMIAKLQGLVDNDLLTHYIRILTTGAPARFVA